jgi:D-3-phosphoglycerate dehydrogenase
VKVLVLGGGYDEGLDGLDVVRDAPLVGDDVVGLLIDTHVPVTEADLERLPSLRVIATASTGFDHVPVEPAGRRGIWVCNVPSYCVEEVAKTTLAFLLALTRGVVALDRHVRAGGWDVRAAGRLRRLRDTRIGIVGFGRIGSAFAERVLALGCEVWAHDPYVAPDLIGAKGVRPVALADLLRESDAVSLHVPLTHETVGLIGEQELATMRSAAVLLNTARGPVVDVDAVARALRAGTLAGAALDVLPSEPP